MSEKTPAKCDMCYHNHVPENHAPDSESQDRANDAPKRTLAKESESEELDEILLNFAKRVEKIPRGKTYGWDEEKTALLRWRTKSLLALLPEKKHTWDFGSEPTTDMRIAKANGYNECIQDIKDKLDKEVS